MRQGTNTAELHVVLPMPHPAQQQVMREAARFNVLECGRRFGKTQLGEVLACETALDGKPVGWFAPTSKQMLEVWYEIEALLKPVTVRANRQDGQIKLITGGNIDFWSLHDTDDPGRSRKYARAIFDEASLMRNLPKVWQEAVRPTLTDLRGDAWFYGTPKGRNYFHSLFQRGATGELGWKSWRFGTVANPYMSADEVEEARRSMPADVYEQEYLGIPAADGGNPFGLDAIAACIRDLSPRPVAAWGVDLAKSQDWTVAVGLDAEGIVARLERWQAPWQVTMDRLVELLTGPALVDATGVGDPIVETLQTRGVLVQGFTFTNMSKQQLVRGLQLGIQQREIGFPDGVLREELESFEYEFVNGTVRYNAPSGFHDDCVCALALAWRHLSHAGVSVPAAGVTGQSYWTGV